MPPRARPPPKSARQSSAAGATPQVDLEDLDAQWPPAEDISNESPAQREERLEREREAKRINDEIDLQIELDRTERRKRRPDVKIILLGQAESGKSTILRNFQLKYTPAAFHAETEAWRAVIDLNLVRSVTFLLTLLDETSSAPSPSAASGSSSTNNTISRAHIPSPAVANPDTPPDAQLVPLQRLTDDLRRLRVRLSPLRSIEEALARFISPEQASPRAAHGMLPRPSERAFEVSVRSGSRWKALFRRGGGASKADSQGYGEVQNARRVIEACREDILALWNHPAVRVSLAEQSVALEFQSGFFLDAVDRIAAPGYTPSADDILKARIQTVGVEEHLLKMEIVNPLATEHGQMWSIIDVGGSRGMRAAWVPYFDDVNVLLFLAPVSAFNQTLTEDRSVNRLWDSFLLWKTVCTHKLLKGATFILLLNKYDLLGAKLRAGIQFRQFVTSYKDRPNDTESILTYLKEKFSAIYQQDPENKQNLHVHVTCATDSNSTSIVLARIREVIFTQNFRKANLL
ncbi:guanine nucleotide binding protein, alpha subunit [Gloeopeniophorella convolvens]|nr:guanine nucleotide binding protein, alpha subunit [Gloeopeniophorella convolvens]